MSIIPQKWHPSWNEFMTDETIKKLQDIESKIGNNYYPKEDRVLLFLQRDLKSFICSAVGMDPYPSAYIDKNGNSVPVATGRSFEIGNVDSWNQKFKQSSLRNILKTVYFNETGKIKSLSKIREEISNKKFNILSPHEWFDILENQVVLFLNSTLTVEAGNPGSHMNIWADFMNDLINYMIKENSDLKWLLWGKVSQERILPLIDEANSIKTCHPRLSSFVSENCFKNINSINWLG